MKKLTPKAAFRKLAALYDRMSGAYGEAADDIGLSCAGCTDNCCLTFFQHHTYIEWAYLWDGLNELGEADRNRIIEQAEMYVAQARRMLGEGERPRIMCPLNLGDGGEDRCGLYKHRLMICRMHGVPNVLVNHMGRKAEFPGCYRTQELCEGRDDAPVLDRTPLLTDLARLEMEFCGKKKARLPKVDHTIAEMIVLGPPKLS